MADSLFDNRYRYDFIYPRGRSGETLRALDTNNADRPVVIKRPAPNDAPPIRAGQEVSILNERKALTRLAGHPVLTEFIAEGQFFVGGMPHNYIVMERAQGMILAEEVLNLARSGERLPILEMLVIVDALLDLLQNAHGKDIVYNDVDAKHLFWNRDAYRLKVIDWGNAVFLEGDEITPQGFSRQSDVQQVGELLYFVLTGGKRADIARDAGEDFLLEFGDDAQRVAPTLQHIVSRAIHPQMRLRYKTIQDLRRELVRFREPIEKDRDAVTGRVFERLRRELSRGELQSLQDILQPALNSDPGHPQARKAAQEINERLRDIAVEADLDAVLIYMKGGNWSRGADLLRELRENAGPKTAPLLHLLLDCCVLMLESNLRGVPLAVQEAIDDLYNGEPAQAAYMLVTEGDGDDETRRAQWLMAERISSHVPEVLLLRPNLYRLELALNTLEIDGANMSDARNLLAEILSLLENLPGKETLNLAELRDGYRAAVDRLATLNTLLATVMVQQSLPNRKLPLSALERATNAAMALADNMHIIGKQAAGSPRDALGALDSSRVIDPTNPLWDEIGKMLNALYGHLQSYQVYVPSADGSDLEGWLVSARNELLPYIRRLFDEMLAGMAGGLEIASHAWADYAQLVVAGNRAGAVVSLADAAQAVGTVSPTLAGWFNQLRSIVESTHYVERHALHGGLGRALADGWEAFDRSRLPDAERLGQQAYEIARSEDERKSAHRLLALAGIVRDWTERNGALSAGRTQASLKNIEKLYTAEEIAARDNFASHMPSRETYLKAMQKGIVEPFTRTSTAALRLYFVNCLLMGTLEAHDGVLEDAGFWQQVAVRVLPELGAKHIATRTLEDFITRSRDITSAVELLNQLNGVHAIKMLESTRRTLEENPQGKVMAGAIQSIREVELMQRDWADAEFRPAGLKLENALKALDDFEQIAGVTVTGYRSWLVELQAMSAELYTVARQMRQIIERRPAEPQDEVRNAHRRLAETTTHLLGDDNAAQLRLWYETYESFLSVYTNASVRRSARLERFNELFRAMFIDRHPAYSLYRIWYDVTESSPEFPAPPTSDPTPRMTETEPLPEPERRRPAAARPQPDQDDDEDLPPTPRRRIPAGVIVAGLVLALVVVAVIVISGILSGDDDGANTVDLQLTISATPNSSATAAAEIALRMTASYVPPTDSFDALTQTAQASADGSAGIGLILETPTLVTRTAVPSQAPATETEIPASATNTDTPEPTTTFTDSPPTETEIPTLTPTPTNTPTPTLPAQGLQGWQDMLAVLRRINSDEYPWNPEDFGPSPDNAAWRLGTGEINADEIIYVMLDADTVDLFYGNNAPSRIRRTDATIVLRSYVPSLLETKEVYFGLLLQSVEDPSIQAGLYIEVVNLNVINLYVQQNDTKTFVRQLSVNTVITPIRLEREPNTGNIVIYYNNNVIGNPVPFTGIDAPVQSVLFIKDGGVIVNVTDWRIGLR